MTTVPPVSSTSNTDAITKTGASSLDYKAFLQLLIAQLKNQDPTQPMDSTQFVAQLATFSQVEQSVSTNSKLDSLLTSSALSLADAAEVGMVAGEALRAGDDSNRMTGAVGEDADLLPSWITGSTANHRRFVWLAVGMTMATFDVTAADALALLRAYSYGHSELLDDIALALIEGRLEPGQIRA